jgi:hypothetical protein
MVSWGLIAVNACLAAGLADAIYEVRRRPSLADVHEICASWDHIIASQRETLRSTDETIAAAGKIMAGDPDPALAKAAASRDAAAENWQPTRDVMVAVCGPAKLSAGSLGFPAQARVTP